MRPKRRRKSSSFQPKLIRQPVRPTILEQTDHATFLLPQYFFFSPKSKAILPHTRECSATRAAPPCSSPPAPPQRVPGASTTAANPPRSSPCLPPRRSAISCPPPPRGSSPATPSSRRGKGVSLY
ncbi:hypothetical protein VPH35_071953 [Triticum aestivum]